MYPFEQEFEMLTQVKSLLIQSHEDVDFIWVELNKHGYANNEVSLIKALQENKSKTITYYASLGLQLYGTKKALPYLKKLVNYPHLDTRAIHVMDVAKISGKDATPYLVKLLADSKFKEKGYVLAAIWEVADSRALAAVIEYTESYILKRKTPVEIINTDLQYIVGFLRKFPNEAKTTELIAKLEQMQQSNTFGLIPRLMSKLKGYSGHTPNR